MRNRIICSKENDCKRLDIQPPLFICAPMVRYSRLAFRQLTTMYGCNLAYTPMIYASCFIASQKCRDVEFITNENDYPIVQFAANKPQEFASAAELVYGKCQGIDLNCGCPKQDVRKRNCGSKLLENPELIADIVRQTRSKISFDIDFSISIKIRIEYPINNTIDLCRKAESAGVSHIAVHGRTLTMRDSEPADLNAIALIKSALNIPVFANGNCKTYEDALHIASVTKADGVMAANGLLENPALFAGYIETPNICVEDWLELNEKIETPFESFHHHLNFMLRSKLSKFERILFNQIKNKTDLLSFVKNYL